MKLIGITSLFFILKEGQDGIVVVYYWMSRIILQGKMPKET